MQRDELPPPLSNHDQYLIDMCTSLRALVDLMTPPQLAPATTVELREPTKPTTRDELQTAAPTSAPTAAAPQSSASRRRSANQGN